MHFSPMSSHHMPSDGQTQAGTMDDADPAVQWMLQMNQDEPGLFQLTIDKDHGGQQLHHSAPSNDAMPSRAMESSHDEPQQSDQLTIVNNFHGMLTTEQLEFITQEAKNGNQHAKEMVAMLNNHDAALVMGMSGALAKSVQDTNAKTKEADAVVPPKAPSLWKAKSMEIEELSKAHAELLKANHGWIHLVDQMNEHFDFLGIERMKSPSTRAAASVNITKAKDRQVGNRKHQTNTITELHFANSDLGKENHDLERHVDIMSKYLDVLAFPDL